MSQQLEPNMGPDWPVEVVIWSDFEKFKTPTENDLYSLKNTTDAPSFEQLKTDLEIQQIEIEQAVTELEIAIEELKEVN